MGRSMRYKNHEVPPAPPGSSPPTGAGEPALPPAPARDPAPKNPNSLSLAALRAEITALRKDLEDERAVNATIRAELGELKKQVIAHGKLVEKYGHLLKPADKIGGFFGRRG